MQYFQSQFLEEAEKFIAGLDPKTIKKILYNIDLAEQTTQSFLRNFNRTSGNFGQSMRDFK